VPGRILIVDDDPLVPRTLRLLLQKQGHEVDVASHAEQAFERLKAKAADVVISDINMPGPDGFAVLQHVKQHHPASQVVLVTGYGTIESAVRGMREGAFDYVTKPVLDEEMLLVVERALEASRLRAENAELRAALDRTKGPKQLIGNDPSLLKVFESITAVAPTRATVLVTGESGTGKSLIARRIHEASPRRGAPFVELNCGALPETLLESELFGHTKGAFTGASGARPGRFLAADRGTLFLDEIGASTPALQLKLLRVLQERKFEPVGSEESVEVDVRLILATNEDLAKAVQEGRFRQDLYYRISVVPVHLPPLRERMGDVPVLAQHFLKRFSSENEKPVREIADSTMTILQTHSWPGNIRELENVIERGVILARGETLMPGDLPPDLTKSAPAPTGDRPLALKRALEIPEREIIERTLRSHDWNRQRTARALDINRTTLFNKMRKYGLLSHRAGHPMGVGTPANGSA
jgi:DNA-binding NtrC family response regulator